MSPVRRPGGFGSLVPITGTRALTIMSGRRHHTPEQVVRKLREGELLLAQILGQPDVGRGEGAGYPPAQLSASAMTRGYATS